MSAFDMAKRIKDRQGTREEAQPDVFDYMSDLTGKPVPATLPAAARSDLVSLLHVDKDGNLSARGITVTKVGLIIPDQEGESFWPVLVRLVRALLHLEGSIAWIVGDALTQMQRTHRVTYEKMAEMFGREVKTLQNWCSIAQAVDISRRREVLSFSHHAEVALIDDPVRQDEILSQAVAHNWSVAKLRREVEGQPDPIPPTVIDKALNYTQRLELKAAKMSRDQRIELAAEFERLADRLRRMEE